MANHRIETNIEIAASPERIWSVLTDFPRMGEWNPFIRSIVGEPRPGARLRAHIAPPDKAGMIFKPIVLVARRPHELRWIGRLLIPGIFDGEHYFLIDPVDGGRVLFTHGEKFSGLLVGLMRGSLRATEDGFHAMNAALKVRAEAP